VKPEVELTREIRKPRENKGTDLPLPQPDSFTRKGRRSESARLGPFVYLACFAGSTARAREMAGREARPATPEAGVLPPTSVFGFNHDVIGALRSLEVFLQF
jgi:hypothetical protein